SQISQEFQLQSAAGSPVVWVAGLYYIHIDEQYHPTDFRYGGSYSSFLGGRINQTLYSRGAASSYAGYGQGTWPLGQATELTLGLRYTIERRSVRASGEQQYGAAPFVRAIPGLPLLTETPLRDSRTFRELTWRASLDRHFSDEVMGYVAVSRGFQSGGWNLQTPQNPAFAPERLDDLEAGVKFADRARRFRADASAFYYDYSDIQVSAITPSGSATTNAASAEVFGLELQLDAQLDRDTTLSLGLQGLRTRYRSFANASCTDYGAAAAVPLLPRPCDATGDRLPFAPSRQVNVG